MEGLKHYDHDPSGLGGAYRSSGPKGQNTSFVHNFSLLAYFFSHLTLDEKVVKSSWAIG